VDFFCYQADAFRVLEERDAQRFAFALPQLQADVVKNLFVLGAQNNLDDAFSGQWVTIPLYNSTYHTNDITVLGRGE
jgi:hypothetical protein